MEYSNFMNDQTSYWYHGSLTNNILKFQRLTHFGSMLSAADAVARKYLESKQFPSNFIKDYHKGEPGYYRVELFITENNCLSLKDWGAPDLRGIVVRLAKYYADDGDSIFEGLKRKLLKDNCSKLPDSELIGADRIFQELECRNIKAIKYPNMIEGNGNETSICVVDPSIIGKISKHMEFEDDIWSNALEKERRKYFYY